MDRTAEAWLRDGVLVVLALAIGWWARPGSRVQAQSSNVSFQMQNVNGGTSLAVYYPNGQLIYVYPGAAVGYSKINCAYEFRLSGPGGAIEREPCKPPSFQP